MSYRKRPTDPPPSIDGRDREASAFSRILQSLVEASPGVIGAAFADEEGETVDYHIEGEPMDVMLAAAYMGLLAKHFDARADKMGTGSLGELWVTAEGGQFLCRPIGQGYQVTVMLEPVATIPKLQAALEKALVRLRIEAGGVID